MKYRLPIKIILTNSVILVWHHRHTLLCTLALPTFLMVLLDISIPYLVNPNNLLMAWLTYAAYLIPLSVIIVNCHRIFILGDDSVSKYGISPDYSYVRFYMWLIALYLTMLIVLSAYLLVIGNTVLKPARYDLIYGSGNSDSSSSSLQWLIYSGWLFALVILGRFSLVLPSAAIGGNPSLKWSWLTTRNNTINMFLIAYAIPWVIKILLNYLYTDNVGAFEYVLLGILGVLLMTIEIAMLSLTFKAFHEQFTRLEEMPATVAGSKSGLSRFTKFVFISLLLFIGAMSILISTWVSVTDPNAPVSHYTNGKLEIENCNKYRTKDADTVCPELYCKKSIIESKQIAGPYNLSVRQVRLTDRFQEKVISGLVIHQNDPKTDPYTHFRCRMKKNDVLNTELMTESEWRSRN